MTKFFLDMEKNFPTTNPELIKLKETILSNCKIIREDGTIGWIKTGRNSKIVLPIFSYVFKGLDVFSLPKIGEVHNLFELLAHISEIELPTGNYIQDILNGFLNIREKFFEWKTKYPSIPDSAILLPYLDERFFTKKTLSKYSNKEFDLGNKLFEKNLSKYMDSMANIISDGSIPKEKSLVLQKTLFSIAKETFLDYRLVYGEIKDFKESELIEFQLGNSLYFDFIIETMEQVIDSLTPQEISRFLESEDPLDKSLWGITFVFSNNAMELEAKNRMVFENQLVIISIIWRTILEDFQDFSFDTIVSIFGLDKSLDDILIQLT